MPKFEINQKVVSDQYRECRTLREYADQIFTVIVESNDVCMTVAAPNGNQYRVKAERWRLASDAEITAGEIGW